MLSENIKTLRKRKGFTQEELAARIHVVRQTVSKWEKGISVPDAETLQKLAEVLEVSVSQLLGVEFPSEESANEIAEQLSRINEQLVIKNRRAHRIWKTIGIVLISIVVLNILLAVAGFYLFKSNTRVSEKTSIIIEESMETETLLK